MSATRPGQLLRHLHPADPDDRSLLARFAGRRDPAAFAALVRRHGPMVYAVCRRVTGHPQDAEDAFQAAFLVLAKKAGVVRDPDRLGNWLYGVAVKVAGRARYVADRRRRREVQVPALPDAPAAEPPPPLDIGPALHEELAALPAHHREPIVLCDLQGLSRADAATALGVPEGTLSSRLANGRKRLADRLTRRGVALTLAAVPGAVVQGHGVVPEALVTRTCGLVAAWAAGEVVPAAVLRLARGGFPMRSVLLGGVLSLSLAAGAALAAGLADSPTDDPPRSPEPLAVAPAGGLEAQPQPKEDDNPGPDRFGPPQLTRKQDLRLKDARRLAWSPDGEWVAVSGTASGEPRRSAPDRVGGGDDVTVVSMTDTRLPAESVALPPGGRLVGFTADGNQLMTTATEAGLISGSDTLQLWSVSSQSHGPKELPQVRLTSGQTFNVPDQAAAFTLTGKSAVRFVVPEFGKDGITRATVRGLDFSDKKGVVSRGEELGPFAAVAGKLLAVQLSPDGTKLAAMTVAGAVEVYGAADGRRVWAADLPPDSYPGPTVWRGVECDYLTFSRNGTVLLAARPRKPPTAFDARTGKRLPAFEEAEPLGGQELWAATVSADGRLVALAYRPLRQPNRTEELVPDGAPRLTVWDTRTGKVVRTWQATASGLAFHPTRSTLAILEAHGTGTRLGVWQFPWESNDPDPD